MNGGQIKNEGRVFTPRRIVDNMLDFMGYHGDAILKKHVMENSCGRGAFLVEIVERYATAFLKRKNASLPALAADLETYVHGIEKDAENVKNCIEHGRICELCQIAEKLKKAADITPIRQTIWKNI